MSRNSSSSNSSPLRSRPSSAPDVTWMKEVGVSFDENNFPHMDLKPSEIFNKLNELVKNSNKDAIDSKIASIKPLFVNTKKCIGWLAKENWHSMSLFRILCQTDVIKNSMFEMTKELFSLTQFESDTSLIREITTNIINDLSFLDEINSDKFFMDQIFESIKQSHEIAKTLLLQSIFSLCTNTEIVVDFLLDFITSDPSNTCEVLRTLSGTKFDKKTKKKCRQKIIDDLLPSVESNDVPSLVQFLFETTDNSNAEETVTSIRQNLTSAVECDSFSSDSETFLLETMKNSMNFKTILSNEFIKQIEKSKNCSEFDFWILIILFNNPMNRMKIFELLPKICVNSLTISTVKKSLENHSQSLIQICQSFTDIISTLIVSTKNQIRNFGNEISKTIFAEITSFSVLQDVVASIITPIGSSNTEIRMNIANLIYDISSSFPTKMAIFLPFIESSLFCASDIEIDVFTIFIKTIVKLEYQTINDTERSTQFIILIQKLVASNLEKNREIGCVAHAFVIQRFSELGSEAYKNMYDSLIYNIGPDHLSLSIFFDTISKNNINDNLCSFLYEKLQPVILSLLSKEDNCVTFKSPSKYEVYSQRKTHSSEFSLFAKSSSCLKLYLECSKKLNKLNDDLYIHKCKVVVDETNITSLFMAHSWITECLNAFCEIDLESSLKQLIYLSSIEKMIANKNLTSFQHPILGQIFSKKKKINEISLITNNDNIFRPLNSTILLLINNIDEKLKKYSKDEQKLVTFGLISLKMMKIAYDLLEKSGAEYISNDVLSFCSSNFFVIDDIIQNDGEERTVDIFNNLSDNFCNFMCKFFAMSAKDHNLFNSSLLSLKRGDNEEKIFKSFIDETNDSKVESKIRVMRLLSTITKYSGNDNKRLNESIHNAARNMLDGEGFNKKNAQYAFSLFIDHSSSPLTDVASFVKNLSKNDYWKSVNEETLFSFCKVSFRAIYEKLVSTIKKLESCEKDNKTEDQDVRFCIINRLTKLVTLHLALVKATAAFKFNASKNHIACNKVIVESTAKFIDTISGTIKFIKEHAQNSKEETDLFFKNIHELIDEIVSVTDNIKSTNSKSIDFLPHALRTISSIGFVLNMNQSKQSSPETE